jgi:omega-6 fatty acid desaturase (delta-12 desaturase)
MSEERFPEAFRAEARAHAARYAGADDRRAALELACTVALFALGMAAFPHAAGLARRGAAALHHGVTARAAFALAGGLLLAGLVALVQVAIFIRTFLINHDLLHGSFLKSRAASRVAALLTGTLSFAAPSVWKREHDRHHRDSNNLDLEQDGQTASWTVERYLAAPRWHRRAYFALNVPWTTYTVLPIAYFFGFMRVKARWYENVLAAALLASVWATGRLGYFLATFTVAAIVGFYLFHLQHTFPGVYKRRTAGWDFFENAMLGSSFLELPRGRVVGRVVRWFSYGVECHHVHHLNPRVPGYRLARCHDEGARLFEACPRVTLLGGLRTLHASLYDERRDRLASVSDFPL